jgi:uncharacterized Zn finger protein
VAKQKQQWWSQAFLGALESCTDRGRLSREGDAPAFWHRDNSFIEAISEIYRQVPLKNPEFK